VSNQQSGAPFRSIETEKALVEETAGARDRDLMIDREAVAVDEHRTDEAKQAAAAGCRDQSSRLFEKCKPRA
jgi:hypothetical protein